MKRAPYLAFLLASLGGAAPALGQDAAAADALFNKGVAEMQAGHFDVACPAVAESQRLDPRPGTLFTLAECEAKAGKIATALVHYDDYLNVVSNLPEAQKQRHAQRVDIARNQKKALAPDVPTLTLTVAKTAPPDLHVSRDGTELSAASLGVALPVDPGEHVVVTAVGSGPKQEQRIKVGKREKKTLEVQWKVAESAPSATSSAVVTAVGTASPAASETGTSGRRIGAYVTGGLGLAGLVLGGVTGGLALGSKGSVDANCPGKVCNETGAKALDSGRTMGLVSTVGFAVGGAGIAAALILWLTEPKTGKPAAVGVSVDVGPSFGMLRLKGAL